MKMMKLRQRHLGRLFAAVVPMLFAHCTKNDETTIIPVGIESYVNDILSVIPDSTMAHFNATFGAISEGYVPTNIEGLYAINPKQRVASNVADWPLAIFEPDATIQFFSQHNGVVGMELYEASGQVTDTMYVIGNGADFTAYVIENKSYDMDYANSSYHVNMKRGIVIKGRMTAEGIRNLYLAIVIMEVDDDSDGSVPQFEPCSYFIYKDGDGLASRINSKGGKQ